MKERVRRLSLRSVVRIRAVGGRYEKFLSDCLYLGIPLSKIEPIDAYGFRSAFFEGDGV